MLGNIRITYDFVVQRKEPLNLRGGDHVERDFVFDGGVLEVVLLDESTGKPVPGAAAMARPMDKTHGSDRIDGFSANLGWADHADEDGVVRLRALPNDAPLWVGYGAPGYERAAKEDVSAGTIEKPGRIEIRLKKDP